MPSNNTENIYTTPFEGGQGAPIPAARISYDNDVSGMTATDVQAAIDELAVEFDELEEYAKSGYLPIVDIGTSYTSELKQDIANGLFKKAIVGGRLTINGHKYLLAHPNYWKASGYPECTTNHMLVVPETSLGNGKMNSSNSTVGAYAGCGLKTGTNIDTTSNTALSDAIAIIKEDFGEANILTHREMFTNAITDGKSSGWTWYDSDIDLMNEAMVYGCNVCSSAPSYETGIDKTQIKLFAERPDLISIRKDWWLRSVASASTFSYVGSGGVASNANASSEYDLRPVFAIC